MLKASTIQLLRFHFSFFLMPVYWFALSQVNVIASWNAVLAFVILHLLVYPSSNGYNSYMDRDEGPVGGIRSPMQPTRQLYYATIIMDIVSVLLSVIISWWFAIGIMIYILASRAYSFRGIRLKQYPVLGYLTVILCQGALVYLMVYHGAGINTNEIPFQGAIAAALLIGGFYPLTQIYQHAADKADNVTSISAALGIRGTFYFTALIYLLAIAAMGLIFYQQGQVNQFLVIQAFFLPILLYFVYWFMKVYKDPSYADHVHTMRMNLLASFCSNAAFITLFILNHY